MYGLGEALSGAETECRELKRELVQKDTEIRLLRRQVQILTESLAKIAGNANFKISPQ